MTILTHIIFVLFYKVTVSALDYCLVLFCIKKMDMYSSIVVQDVPLYYWAYTVSSIVVHAGRTTSPLGMYMHTALTKSPTQV